MEQVDHVRAVFESALDLTGKQRTDYLDRATAGDDALRQRVQRLIAAAEDDDAFLSCPTVGPGAETAGSGERPGTLIDRYKLIRLIGEGGFGSVWLAEQQRPVVRQVALKLIKLGMDTRQVIARFEAERQALALMDHPNISRVYDAGATETGRPFFVMELVSGQPITVYCNARELTLRDRLHLFTQVCQAVQHAHTKGIIHRDLKPTNVLVSDDGGEPVVKIIDFGIAKATVTQLTEGTLLTGGHPFMGTPQYMSPEQAEGSADIDTRTDIYSLGVLLYELLAGAPPFDGATLHSAGYSEMQRIIREVDPPRPSTRLARAVSPSREAQGTATQLQRSLVGDLDWIVMRAIEKQRSRRYETASQLELDVRRYLAGEPVSAVPPTRAYRLRKFLVRNKVLATATALVAVALLLGMVGTSTGLVSAISQKRVAELAQYREAEQRKLAEANELTARREAERAVTAEAQATLRASELERVAEFQARMLSDIDMSETGNHLMSDLRQRFAAALAAEDPSADQRLAAFDAELRQINATDAAAAMIDRTILQPAVLAIDAQFSDQPLVDASLRMTLGQIYTTLGRYDDAISLTRRALELCETEVGEEHPYTIRCLISVGRILLEQDKPEEAEGYLIASADAARRVIGAESPQRIDALRYLGSAHRARGDLAGAEQTLRECLSAATASLGESDPDTLQITVDLASLLRDRGKLDRSEELFRQAVATARATLGEDHRITQRAINHFAVLLRQMEKFEEAEPLYREALAHHRRVWGEDHQNTLQTMNNLGDLLTARGQFAEASSLVSDTLAKCRSVLGNEHSITLIAINNAAQLLRVQGRYAEAEPLLREAMETRCRISGDEHPLAIAAAVNLGAVLGRQRKFAEAQLLLTDALDAATRTLGSDHVYARNALGHLCTVYLQQGLLSEAESCQRDLLARAIRHDGPDSPSALNQVSNLAALLQQSGKFAEAEQHLRHLLSRRMESLGEDHPQTLTGTYALATVLWNEAKLEEAESLARRGLVHAAKGNKRDQWAYMSLMHRLGTILRDTGRLDEAETRLRSALENRRRVYGEQHRDTLTSAAYLGLLLAEEGRPDEAEALLRSAVPGLRRAVGASDRLMGIARLGLGLVHIDRERYEQAERELVAASDAFATARDATDRERREGAQALVTLYETWHTVEPGQGLDQKAAQWRQKLSSTSNSDRPNAANAQVAPDH